MSFDTEHTPQSEKERQETTRLSEAWNAYADGDVAALNALDPRDAATLRRLNAISPHVKPRHVFVRHLKESLMETALPVSPDGADAPAPHPDAMPATAAGRELGTPRRWWGHSIRELGTAAMIAILVVGLAIGYLAFATPDSGYVPGGVGDVGTEATPGTVLDRYPSCAVYGVGCPFVENVGDGFINKPDYTSADLAAKKVQLVRWTIEPGATVEIPADTTRGVHGAIVDVVVAGTYVVTVDSPATIGRMLIPRQRDFAYLQPGGVAELNRGDTISYPAGKARTLTNPLTTIPLTVISVVVYDGDAALTRPVDPLPAGVQMTIGGEGELPMTLAEYRTREVIFDLEYLQVQPTLPLPETRYGTTRVIGPVLPVQPEIEEGYVLWVGESRG